MSRIDQPGFYRIDLPGFRLESMNRLFSMKRGTGYKYRDYKEFIYRKLDAYFTKHKRPVVANGVADLHFIRYSKCELDEDNLNGSVKPFIDVLKDFGVLEDDTPEFMTYSIEQRHGKTRLVVDIKRIPVQRPGSTDEKLTQNTGSEDEPGELFFESLF